MSESSDFINNLKQLDEDALIQTRRAVDECLEFLQGKGICHLVDVQDEAMAASRSIEREFLRRAMFERAKAKVE